MKNIEAEEFLNHHSQQIKSLEKAIHETFRGKGVNPYIFVIIQFENISLNQCVLEYLPRICS